VPERFLIIGLGNPGKDYADTRHNIGFMALDSFAKETNCSFKKSKFMAHVAEARVARQSVILAKPTTYMNNSGQAVSAIVNYYKIADENILIVYDDADLPLGKMRLREKGGSGGHRGMASIISHLSTQNMPRLRLGISSEYGRDKMSNFVLSSFAKNEQESVADMVNKTCNAIEQFIIYDIEKVMNVVNTKEA
jgi:peptidyl-tRNA hydrolase, PTH1 family